MDGMELNWGNAKSSISLVEKVARREGIGDIFAEGVKIAAERLGGNAAEAAMHVKGLEFSGHDPRAFNGIALAYATSARGACHLSALTHPFERILTLPEFGFNEPHNRFGTEGKGKLTAKLQDLMGVFDSLKICKFVLFGGVRPKHLTEWLNFVTGWDYDLSEIMKCGERIFNLKRLYNVRCGITGKDDNLPKRILTHKRGSGSASENLPPLETMLIDYYAFRGWDESGIPTCEKLSELGL